MKTLNIPSSRLTNFTRCLSACAFALFSSAPVHAHEYKHGTIRIDHPVAPASLPGQSSATVYLTIENQGASADRLLTLESPAAKNVVVHRMTMNGAVMAMREMDDLPIKPSTKVELTAGGNYHVMMTGLKQPLVAMDKIPLTLTFERAGKVEVTVNVESRVAGNSTPKAETEAATNAVTNAETKQAKPHHHH